MRIYNATNSVISLPYVGSRITINPHSVSGDLGANNSLLSLIVTAYDTTEVAFIVAGPYELNMCYSLPTVPNYVVQSLEEAIERFTPKMEKEEPKVVEEDAVEDYSCDCCSDACDCPDCAADEKPVEEEVVDQQPAPVEEEQPKTVAKTRKKKK